MLLFLLGPERNCGEVSFAPVYWIAIALARVLLFCIDSTGVDARFVSNACAFEYRTEYGVCDKYGNNRSKDMHIAAIVSANIASRVNIIAFIK